MANAWQQRVAGGMRGGGDLYVNSRAKGEVSPLGRQAGGARGGLPGKSTTCKRGTRSTIDQAQDDQSNEDPKNEEVVQCGIQMFFPAVIGRQFSNPKHSLRNLEKSAHARLVRYAVEISGSPDRADCPVPEQRRFLSKRLAS